MSLFTTRAIALMACENEQAMSNGESEMIQKCSDNG